MTFPTTSTACANTDIFANDAMCFSAQALGYMVEAAESLQADVSQKLADLVSTYDASLIRPTFDNAGYQGAETYTEPTEAEPARPTNFAPAEPTDPYPTTPSNDYSGATYSDIESNIASLLSNIGAPAIDAILSSSEFESLINSALAKLSQAVDLPEQGSLLTDAEYDAIYDEAALRIQRQTTRLQRNALEQLSGFGIGMASAALTARLREAEQTELTATSEAALAQAAEQARGTRADILAIIGLELQRAQPLLQQMSMEASWKRDDIARVFQAYIQAYAQALSQASAEFQWSHDDGWKIVAFEEAKFKAEWAVRLQGLQVETADYQAQTQYYLARVQNESTRINWVKLNIDEAFNNAKTEANLDMQWNNLTLQKLGHSEEVIIEVQAAMFQAWISAVNLQFQATGSQSVVDRS